MHPNQDPIIALATPQGVSAIAVVRLSGKGVIGIVNGLFCGSDLTQQASHTIHFGLIKKGDTTIDEVLVSIFIAPHSFTKEDSVEISCHGAPFIVSALIELFVAHGVRIAEPGEFTKRAFLNGRFDLAQAEAVADLIAADSALAHQTALHQMRGGFSSALQELRKALRHFAAMLTLELDFAEEDVEFLDRKELHKLADALIKNLTSLIDSFQLGNVIKQGVAVAIVGKPNVGKSTLLNALLQEERAIVSPIAGTTRDTIEGILHLGGIPFRFVDTAGLRENTSDAIEAIGIERTKAQLKKAFIVLYLVDLSNTTFKQAAADLVRWGLEGLPVLKIGNKIDLAPAAALENFKDYLLIAAQTGSGVAQLKDKLLELVAYKPTDGLATVVINARHYDRLQKSKQALTAVITGLEQKRSNELLVVDINSALYALGEITGEITTEEILGEIFSKFCIGK
ncbi:MAG: tRNA uridine-5-carboxymethylaminomethyl(34) synthesis GTPase MnmE [Candidatus Cardinium sp.]|uniref:tRNA uridine-5-carboxymethylaminomethyl(34) synthesis GTPase MnmE n=1 Tax=Cardinium endosymbiont of Dermatophagoides farinae TaxID=2597823 RepID=UPI0011828AF1|nr:tRNA uridine-5-carboxymethylaminomethyl(34) synthesis GTPase MnmE [Cardinium endosymbiont of Dermatophagoides farinae]TSJ80955.1 tRNA uridine-5-carboxymethylaminomethyl(34) synthesis GTPase MnmE [Cardinium endosymbiont of Dermatophagoides farinae]UWW96981.1 MAG: tRNA uridine-5-carboxymethylaminomethyl(34) synthesis GTPase MnmE [Candidatus Cardinium sp.]